MTSRIARNRDYLTRLFSGPMPGHALIVNPPVPPKPGHGDLISDPGPLDPWLDWLTRRYEDALAWHEALDDDSVPYLNFHSGTEVFAAAFGCRIHVFEDSPPAAMPLVTTAAEADALELPGLDHPILERLFEAGRRLRQQLGPEVPISVPDIQSPFDIAALIWHKQDLMLATYDDPGAVERLVGKCETLLVRFLEAWRAELGEINYCHCPTAWAPNERGCWLSEDEAGALSTAMFEQFCLPVLTRLSEHFGGLFMHCCATADHQYQSFRKVPRLRALNRVFQYPPGYQPAIDAFSGETVLMMAWVGEPKVNELLDHGRPDTRWLFDLSAPHLDEAKALCDRLRERCPRV